ncbi:MAG TPA: Ig-like domain repeat protein [Pyrinomonadaceae bacterium]|nr:Ig-like domain repeat protein [Pyrinomonadaceae bacterium]
MKKNISIIRRNGFVALQVFVSFLLLMSMILSPIAATAHTPHQVQKEDPVRIDQPVQKAEPVNTATSDRAAPDEAGALLAPFTNSTTINIPDNPTVGSPYPSTIAVSGLVGTISSVSVTLNGFTSPRPSNLDFLLVGPGGQKLIILSDAGANLTAVGPITFTLADSGAANVPANPTNPANGTTYKPTDYDTTDPDFPSPAPVGPYNRPITTGTANTATFASVFNGLSGANVNGNWNLYAFDDAGGGGANSLAGGWTIDITVSAGTSTTTTVTSSANPSFRQNPVTFTATIAPNVGSAGTVTFTDGAVTLCAAVAVNASSQAQCVVPANTLSEGTHTVTGTYSGGGSFAGSNGNILQTVNNQTVIVGNNFTNPGTITINDNLGGASGVPYPSNIFVSGLSGTISKVTLTLTNLNLPRTSDVDFLLVGPNGDKYIFVSDVGTAVVTSGVNITLDDAAGSQLPSSGALSTGTFRPTDFASDSDTFPAPAPAGPYNSAPTAGVATFASVYGGDAPNGMWSLYFDDDAGGGGNSTVGSWTLTLTTSGDAATTTVLSSSPNPSTTAQSFLLTANVTSTSTVNAGTVTFRNGATVLCATVAVVSGVATCNVPAQPQGTYVLTADYNGAPGQFNISSGTVTQQVNSPTVVTCTNFANNGGITVSNATQIGSPYPSNIIVSGLGGAISKVTLTMTITSAITPDDNDFLLVGPGGQKFVFMGDAGGNIDIVGQTITFDDAAATLLPDNTAITTGTYRPASYGGATDTFPAPAPAAPYTFATTDGAGTFALFNGGSPNGTWSLYATEDAGDAANTVIGSWSLTFTLAAATTTTSVSSSADPSVFGQPVTFTATVSTAGLGTPTGNVQFFDGATPIGGAVALNASGQAQVTTSTLSTGSHTITASYAGASAACTGTFNSSSGSLTSNPQTVNQASTTTVISGGANPSSTGQPVTFTATVTASAPSAASVGAGGTVTFSRNGSPVCSNVALNASGQATCTITFTIAGNYNITAAYSGNTNFLASNNNASPRVQQVLGPTAANARISGQVRDGAGRAIGYARIAIQNQDGATVFALTNPFGYYTLDNVPAGQTYIVTVTHKRYQFAPRTITLSDDIVGLDFIAESDGALAEPSDGKPGAPSP